MLNQSLTQRRHLRRMGEGRASEIKARAIRDVERDLEAMTANVPEFSQIRRELEVLIEQLRPRNSLLSSPGHELRHLRRPTVKPAGSLLRCRAPAGRPSGAAAGGQSAR